MSITSFAFVVFFAVLFLLYYIIPKGYQWIILLVGSMVFYASNGINNTLYIIITSITVYISTRWMFQSSKRYSESIKANKQNLSREERLEKKRKNKRQRKTVMITTVLFNLGILCYFKYSSFLIDQANSFIRLFGATPLNNRLSIIVPLGISFYTFQSIGYIVDVYWGNCIPEDNYFKTLLFVSFFPQITQGPISDFKDLSTELYSEHKFQYKNFSWGAQRVIWGLTKKLLLADIFGTYVRSAFINYSQYTGITVLLGAFMYSVQIYADFSGYMDIVCGLCEILGIRLTENFDRPYFSKSVAEYWRRWHITLGAWFKKYIYYPIGVSTWNRNLAKRSKKVFGKHFSDSISPSIALIVTWLATGLWHGANWTYITWGLINGFFIILSIWMEPVYNSWKTNLRINQDSRLWRAFQVVRSFVLITMIKVFPEVGSFSDGIGYLKRIVTNHTIPRSISELLPFVQQTIPFILACCVLIVLFAFSLIQRKNSVRSYFNRLPCTIRIIILAGVSVIIGLFADLSSGGFMYARF